MEVNKLGDIGLHTGNLIKKKKTWKKQHDVSSEIRITDMRKKLKERKWEKWDLKHLIILLFPGKNLLYVCN